MGTKYANFPDIEAICAQIMRSANVAGGRVYSSMPRTPTWPLALVIRVGGIPSVERWVDSASIQVDVYGNNKSEARSVADDARVALHMAEGSTVGSGVVTSVQDNMGLTFLPDPDTNRDRYTFGVTIGCHTT